MKYLAYIPLPHHFIEDILSFREAHTPLIQSVPTNIPHVTLVVGYSDEKYEQQIRESLRHSAFILPNLVITTLARFANNSLVLRINHIPQLQTIHETLLQKMERFFEPEHKTMPYSGQDYSPHVTLCQIEDTQPLSTFDTSFLLTHTWTPKNYSLRKRTPNGWQHIEHYNFNNI